MWLLDHACTLELRSLSSGRWVWGREEGMWGGGAVGKDEDVWASSTEFSNRTGSEQFTLKTADF